MAPLNWRAISRIGLIYAGAIGAGYVTSLLRVPLPWMIGPMILAGAASVLAGAVRVPRVTRPIGQTLIAASVGLAFTPAAVTAVSQQIVAMLVVALLTILCGFLVAALLMRLTRIDVISASLASIPGGPVEMAALATRHGVDPGPVAFAQILRIALLVLIIPPLLVAIDGSIDDPTRMLVGEAVDPLGATLLLVVAVAGGLSFRLIGISSPFFLGPLAFSAVASALLLPVSGLPFPLIAAAQVLLGVWLGTMFDRELLGRAQGFLVSAFASTIVLLVLCAAMAFGVSAATGIAWQTMVLATAPGSVTEMALTAKILQEGVALVTAFHVVRIFVILPAAPLIFAMTARIAGKLNPEDAPASKRGK